MKNALLIFISLLFFSSVLFSEDRIETIQLNHRLASEVLPEIQAFLPKQATARAFNDFIILQADNKTIQKVKRLIHQLDTPVQRLKVTVVRTDQQLTTQNNKQISAGIAVENNDVAGHMAVSKWSTKNAKNKDQYYQAQGVADSPIAIHLGENIPQQEQYLVLRNDGDLAIQNTTHYINMNNGFKAVARVLPNHQVTIEIHPLFGQFSHQTGTIEQTNMISTVSGQEGSWILLGVTNNGKNIEQSGTTQYHSHEHHQQSIYIKVEQLL